MRKRNPVPWNVVARLALICLALPLFIHLTAQKNPEKPAMEQVQIAAQFPGGKTAWQKYLEMNQRPDALVSKGAPPGNYRVTVSFIVDTKGNLSEIHGLNDPGFGAKAEAERLIKVGPNWLPAIQNGKAVKYRQKQDITFQISED